MLTMMHDPDDAVVEEELSSHLFTSIIEITFFQTIFNQLGPTISKLGFFITKNQLTVLGNWQSLASQSIGLNH